MRKKSTHPQYLLILGLVLASLLISTYIALNTQNNAEATATGELLSQKTISPIPIDHFLVEATLLAGTATAQDNRPETITAIIPFGTIPPTSDKSN